MDNTSNLNYNARIMTHIRFLCSAVLNGLGIKMTRGGLGLKLFDSTLHSLEHSLDYATQKNRVISDNIANADTPNYKAKDVVFKDVFQEATTKPQQANFTTQEKHIPFQSHSKTNFPVVTNKNTMYNNNRNNVDIDKEMSSLAENQIYYQSLVDRLNGKFNDMQTVIRGGN